MTFTECVFSCDSGTYKKVVAQRRSQLEYTSMYWGALGEEEEGEKKKIGNRC